MSSLKSILLRLTPVLFVSLGLIFFQNCAKLSSVDSSSTVDPKSCRPEDNCEEPVIPADALDIKSFANIKCDGVSSDQSALQAAITKIGDTPAAILISCKLTTTADLAFGEYTSLYFLGSGSINVSGEVPASAAPAIAINGDLKAGRYKVFSGFQPGKITFTKSSRVLDIFPEWFGALGGARGDDQIPFEAAFKAMTGMTGQRVNLRGTYYSVSKCGFVIDQPATGLVGQSGNFSAILCRSIVPNTNIVTVNGTGPDAEVNDVFVRDLALVSTENVSGRAGLYLAFLVNFRGENIVSTNNTTQFFFSGVGSSQCVRCQGMYEFPLSGEVYGFRIDGTNWNASLRILNSNAGLASSSQIGSLESGNFYGAHVSGEHINDLKFNDFETSIVHYGVYVVGSGKEDRDILFENNIHDTFYRAGYHFENLGPDAGVSVRGGWVGPAGIASDTYGVDVLNSHALTIKGVTFHHYDSAGDHYHVRVRSSSELSIGDNNFKNGAYGVYAQNSSSIAISGNVFSAAQTHRAKDHVALVSSAYVALNGNSFSGYGDSAVHLYAGSGENRLNGNTINPAFFGAPIINEGIGNLISP